MHATTARSSLSRAGLFVLCATTFFSVTNASMSSIALPDIGRDFGRGPDALSWVVVAYLVPFATGTVVYGRLGDTLGTKQVFLFGMVVFAISSFLSAAAPNFELLIVARAIQGLGGAAMPALSFATIIRTTTPSARGSALGAIILTVGVGYGVGPLLGGVLVDVASWQGPFLVMGAGIAAVAPFAIKYVPGVAGARGERFDIAGALLLGAGVTAVVIALNRLPARPADVTGLVALVVAVPAWALFAWRARTASAPVINREVSRSARFWGLSFMAMMSQGGHFAIIVMIPLLFSRYFGLSTIETGFYLLPGATALAACGMAGGVLLNRLGERVLLVGGTMIFFAGLVLFHVAGAGWEPWGVAIVYGIVAAGYGLVNAAMLTAATGSLPERLAGIASGTFNLVFFLGGAVSVALTGAILRRREGASGALDPLFTGTPVEFSDAALVVVGFALVGLLLALRFAKRPENREAAVTAEIGAEPSPQPR